MKFTNVKQLIIKFMGGGLINFPTRFLRWVKINGDGDGSDDGGGGGGGGGDITPSEQDSYIPLYQPAKAVYWVPYGEVCPYIYKGDNKVELKDGIELIPDSDIITYIRNKFDEFKNPNYTGNKYISIFPIFKYEDISADIYSPRDREGCLTAISIDEYSIAPFDAVGLFEFDYNDEKYIGAFQGFD